MSQALDDNNLTTPKCPYLGPREKIKQWEAIGADKVLMHGIKKGVKTPMHAAPPPQQPRAMGDVPKMTATIGQYLANNTIQSLPPEKARQTRFWVHVFGREKKDSGKVRLITDFRPLNACQQVLRFKGTNWKHLLQTLQNQQETQWGLTLDLADWFHHLELHPSMKRWSRIMVDDKAYQLVGMPFGWASSPWWAQKMAKPIQGWLHQQGILHCWYVDDILILGSTKEDTEMKATLLVNLLTSLGVRVNQDKSMKEARQCVTYLGHQVDLHNNMISPVEEKIRGALNMTKKQAQGNNYIPRHMAQLAGTLIDLTKSNICLRGLPQQIMRQVARGVHLNKKYLQLKTMLRTRHNHGKEWSPGPKRAWEMSLRKPAELRKILSQIQRALQHPVPHLFRGRLRRTPESKQWRLQSDACETGWGAVLIKGNKEIAAVAQPWEATQLSKHITHLEALASARAVGTLLKYIPAGTTVTLQVDASSTMWAWIKGSKISGINQPINKAHTQATQKGVHIQAEHIQGIKNKRADYLSRNTDPKNYQLDPTIFRNVCNHFKEFPVLDLFANRQNRQTNRYCSWRADSKSVGNAWEVDWATGAVSRAPRRERLGLRRTPESTRARRTPKALGTCWLNPPWELAARALAKVKQDKAKALVCLPVWRTATWWPMLQSLLQGPPLLVSGKPLYRNPQGEELPPPRWGTLFGVIHG